MLGSVEGIEAVVALHPDRDVLELRVDVPAGCEQCVCVAPIHAHKVNGAISAVLCKQPAGLGQELDELLSMLSGALRKIAMPDFSLPGDTTVKPEIVARINEHHVCAFLLH